MLNQEEVQAAYDESRGIAEQYATRRKTTGLTSVYEFYWYTRSRLLYWILTKHNDVGAEILGALEGYSRFTSKEQRMARAKAEALGCQRCGLCSTRQNVVFGEGTLWTPLMIITEGPNSEEDAVGRPLVGKDAWFMDWLYHKLGYHRDHIYITNVVKCRPVNGNQDRYAKPDEVAQCSSYLDRQISIIDPKVILTLGATPANYLLNPGAQPEPASSFRGQIGWYDQYPVVSIHMPGHIQEGERSAEAWEDLDLVRRLLQADGEAILMLRMGRCTKEDL